ncbi:MAG: DUF6398 domain-containing protein [Candidatus Methanofastidiosia archaeon]|jgi:hypothetical protein
MRDKTAIQKKMRTLIKMTAEFCDIYLDEDYKKLSKKLIQKMARKREVPFLYGQIEIWAAAVIYALGTTNLLYNKSFEPYIAPDTICSYFKTNKSTTYQKSKRIRDMLNIKYRDKEFSTPYIIENDPLSHLRIPEELATQLKKLMEEMEKKSILELSKNVKIIHNPKKRKGESNSKRNNKDDETLKQLKLSDFKEEHEAI